MKTMTRADWAEMWRELDNAMRNKSLNEAAKICDRMKREWQAKHGLSNAALSNKRWVAYLEDLLEHGTRLSGTILADVKPEDMQFDAFCFPHLKEALKKAGVA